jgi:flavin-dependent dehydrogenase
MLAGRIAAQAIMSNQTKRSFLKKYDRLWNAKYRNNTRLMLLLRLYLNSLSRKNTTKLFAHLMKPSIKQLIEKEGDIDEQSEIILEMLKQWSLTPFLIKTGVSFSASFLKNRI